MTIEKLTPISNWLFDGMTEEQFREAEKYIEGFKGLYLDLRKDEGRAYYKVGRGFAITDANERSVELEKVDMGIVIGMRKIGGVLTI